jgi:plasmid stabilization system protein ParE
MAKVTWLPDALQDVARLYEFLVEKSPEAAGKAAGRIAYVARQLEQYPEMGQPMEDGVRRQVFLHFGAGAYVIRYRRDREGNVVIVRVWHSREQRES